MLPSNSGSKNSRNKRNSDHVRQTLEQRSGRRKMSGTALNIAKKLGVPLEEYAKYVKD